MENNKNPRLFISLPMRGKSDYEILEKMNSLYKQFEYYHGPYVLIDSFVKEEAPDPSNKMWYLGDSIQQLGMADAVLFADDYESAPGCLVEYTAAKLYGIPMYFEKDLGI